MKALIVPVLCASLVAPGCALPLRSIPIRVSLPAAHRSPAAQDVSATYASQLPVGRRVDVALKDGSRFEATFMGVEGDAVRLQKRTRIPESPLLVPLDRLAALSLHEGGMGGGTKAALIGIGVGAATFFGLLLIAIAGAGN